MLSTIATSTTTKQDKKTYTADQHIFVLELYSGEFVLGQGTNIAKRVSAINSGYSPAVPQSLQVKRIVDVRPVNEERNLISVCRWFIKKYGDDKVIVV